MKHPTPKNIKKQVNVQCVRWKDKVYVLAWTTQQATVLYLIVNRVLDLLASRL
jgi:hypothetical protein